MEEILLERINNLVLRFCEELGVELDARGNVKANAHKMTSLPGIFTAGDMTRGQSLVVWAIHEGRAAAEGVNQYLLAQQKAKV